ncbi:PQQ-dependent sugar dehydrogenase [Spirosoma aureum]|uniref:PQQ-dependent sugar dehydrogenase n=1 Tax=Spirosoma aureum TaxID=2692134 RepID=A0A6G9AM00_9BACT|nr:PQQ-dependent sugar dehydrogenase [Spirosoma aureum]QIP13438.1 PQQ-dependent sugar dehydrogenase [Spirosoma aureum]
MKKTVLQALLLPKNLQKTTVILVSFVISCGLASLIADIKLPVPTQKPLQGQPAVWKLENAFPNLTFRRPVEFTCPRDGSNRIFVLEQEGIIRVFENKPTVQVASVYLDVTKKVSHEGEMGLLGLAFHPDFSRNGYFYIYYTKRNPLESVIARYQATTPDLKIINPATETVILRFAQPYDNHNGGKIAFGPDGYLYIATGDGGAWGDPHQNAQNRASWLGKILRIDVDKTTKGAYGIPADNPFVNNREGYREEIYAYGLRNPWRFSFDRQTGRIWAGDVGQNQFEEIDIITKGGNYGWRLKEAIRCYNPRNDCDPGDLIDPIHHYGRDEGTSITGGVVYRGSRHAALQGKYLYADYASGKVWALTFENDKKTSNQLLAEHSGTISAFGEDAAGEVYLLDHQGTIKRFSMSN